ncbi:hypothetical protein M9Y10_020564 [Tritrichomonas musculus]|uniref:Uncharacterized protein n=1 Tax=Tritrichomonas musculus TaxID=1915356 RepID=A0ABR2HDY8_9EUKA
MAAGLFNKIKKTLKSVGGKIKNFAKKAVKSIPKIIDTGKMIIDKVKPAVQFIPGVGEVVNAIDTGLNYANKGYKIGKSILDEVK